MSAEAASWDPTQYRRFSDMRLRPAFDLLATVEHPAPRIIHDVGCGTGQIARVMASRWPSARVIGSDASPEMLAEARHPPSRVEWIQHDVRDWAPDLAPDIVYANAVFHWVPQHGDLVRTILGSLRPGGVLAFQVPLSWHEPSHRLIRECLAGDGSPLGTEELRTRLAEAPVHTAEQYHEILVGDCSEIDIWETTYLHRLHGADAVYQWVKGTTLRPLIDALTRDELERFERSYRPALRMAYPQRHDGVTLYRFPRLFVVCRRR